MPTYAIKAPNGQTYQIDGPAGASDDDVRKEVLRQFPDAGSAPRPRKPILSPIDAKRGLDKGSAQLEQRIANLPEKFKRMARDQYFEKTRPLREASAVPISTKPKANNRGQRIQETAQRVADRNAGTTGNFLTALNAGFRRGAFGVPERLGAAMMDRPDGVSYDDALDLVRAKTDAELDKSMGGNILGQILSGAIMGRGAGSLLGAMTKGAPIANVAARFATAAPKTAKATAIVGAGAAGGGLQAAGEGSDVATGAGVGALATPVLMGLGKAAGYLLRPVGDVLGLPSAGKILQRFTKAKSDDIRRAADEYRQTTGAEPTLYEILPLADRNKLAADIVGRSPQASERTAAAVRRRVSNVGPEMARSVETATGGRRARVVQQMRRDLAETRGGVAATDGALAAGATRGPLPADDFREAISENIMAPVRDTPGARDVQSMFPTTLSRNDETGEVSEVYSDPEMNAAIQNAAGSLRLRAPEGADDADIAGITANDIAQILTNLSKKKPGQDGYGAAQRAIPHLLDQLETRAPEAAEAIATMRTRFAANSRLIEGMQEGHLGRTRETAPISREQPVRNAYDTPEGTTGRFLGQGNRLAEEFAGTPRDALRTAEELATSGQAQAALRGNLGDDEAAAIAAAAEAQTRSARALGSLDKERGAVADSLNSEDLGRMLLALNPGSMPTTKLFALSRLTKLTRLPERKANTIIDMLFSQDPAATNRAIGLLNNAGQQGRDFLKDIGRSLSIGARTGQLGNMEPGEAGPAFIPEAEAGAIEGDTEEIVGLLEPGNIDLDNREVVENEDGTISTVRSISVGFDDGTYLIPTVVNGEVVSDDEAIAHFKQTGEHLGKFESVEAADAYAQQLHEQQGEQYGDEEFDDRPFGRSVIEDLYPDAHITDDVRDPESALGRKNPDSYHVQTDEAVDVRPIPGMTFDEFIAGIEDEGYEIVEAIDEVTNPSGHATGPHWHVVIKRPE